jgi:hypothetical protein
MPIFIVLMTKGTTTLIILKSHCEITGYLTDCGGFLRTDLNV